MKTKEVLYNLRQHYKEHLKWCKETTDHIAAHMSDNGFGCTVFVDDNLQIEIQYNIPRGGPKTVSELRIGFYKCLNEFCTNNGLIKVMQESSKRKDYCLPEEYTNFYTERVVLDVE